ncbi:site-specific integrase [Luteolibacter pohnpeiensis]|uniref:Site-specific integrase n=2 Tax=Luteolibacter pohnpeiensis TaxID=454153 RepID=A0A934SER7_9BACT|nr:site-specific integrase [Luteolibacter pohnpeiensis]
MADPSHKKGTKTFYSQIFPLLRRSLPLDRRADDWTKDDARAWWAEFSATRNSSQCNICLHILRRTLQSIVEAGIRSDNPTAGLKRKRQAKPAVEDLPGIEILDQLLESMREKRGKDAANKVEFLAWSGVRISELLAIDWSDISNNWLTVTGGEQGTKNHEIRRVPINNRLETLITKLRYEGASGKVFQGGPPRKALNLACDRIGIPRLRIHDLRHWFATYAIEKGVDIPTVSKWLGHKDGGALAMRIYGHLRDEHSLSAARKL